MNIRSARPAILLLLAALSCTTDKRCKNGTALLTFAFSDSYERVDGVALRCQLDGEAMVDLKPLVRPAGASQGTLELDVKNYFSRKQLLIQYAPLLDSQVVGDWQGSFIRIEAGCTTAKLTIGMGTDGGHLDGSMSVDGLSSTDGRAPIDARAYADACADTSAEQAKPIDGAISQPDRPMSEDLVVADVATFPDIHSPDQSPGADAASGSRDGPVGVPGVSLLRGGLGTVGPHQGMTTIRLLREGFEERSRVCVNGVCVTGGVVP